MKIRLGLAIACTLLLAGCPDASDDMRRGRGDSGDAALNADFVPDEFVCANVRPWREDLDLPDYLKNPAPAAGADPRDNEEAGRERKKREYIERHQGTLTICHTVLEKDLASNRGTCPICTAMLKDPQWKDKRINHNPGGQTYGDAIELLPEQEFAQKIEFRLKWVKEDYLTKADDQIASYKDWLSHRNLKGVITGWDASKTPAEPIVETDPDKLIAYYLDHAKAKGIFTKDEANPKSLPKFGLPPLAEPLVRCPNCKKPIQTTQSQCWNCNIFYTLSERDERNSITEPQELLCPFCHQPVDPDLNYCSNPKCEKFHRAIDREGVCWKCGGSGLCPECLGSGKGHGPIEGGDDCYLCGGKAAGASNGMCPECNGTGFTIYDGALPPGYSGAKRVKNDWKLPTATGPTAKAGGAADSSNGEK